MLTLTYFLLQVPVHALGRLGVPIFSATLACCLILGQKEWLHRRVMALGLAFLACNDPIIQIEKTYNTAGDGPSPNAHKH